MQVQCPLEYVGHRSEGIDPCVGENHGIPKKGFPRDTYKVQGLYNPENPTPMVFLDNFETSPTKTREGCSF